MRSVPGLLVLCSVILLSAGCTVRTADFSVASSKQATFPIKSLGKRVSGESCIFSLWLIHFSEPSIKEAMDQALSQVGPEFDALADVVVHQKIGFFSNCIRVQGTAIGTKPKTP